MAQLSSTRFNILLTLYTIHFLLINRTSRTASYCLFFPVHWHPSTSSVKKPLQRSSRGGESANRETGCGGWLSTTCVDHTPGFSPARSSPARPNTIPPLLPATIHHNKTRIHLRLAHADVLNSVRPLHTIQALIALVSTKIRSLTDGPPGKKRDGAGPSIFIDCVAHSVWTKARGLLCLWIVRVLSIGGACIHELFLLLIHQLLLFWFVFVGNFLPFLVAVLMPFQEGVPRFDAKCCKFWGEVWSCLS